MQILFCSVLLHRRQIQLEWYKNPSRVIFSSLSSRQNPQERTFNSRGMMDLQPDCVPRLTSLSLSSLCFVLRESSEHFQKSASKQILCSPMAMASCTWIGDYPNQVQIAEWQDLEEHRVRFTSWCVTEQGGVKEVVGIQYQPMGGPIGWYWEHMKPDCQRACSSNVLGAYRIDFSLVKWYENYPYTN